MSRGARFEWKKLGRVYVPSGEQPWLQSHCQNPTPLLMDDRIRVFFNCRPKPGADGLMMSTATFIDLALDDPKRVLAAPEQPILPFGKLGTFDEFGVMVSSVLRKSASEVWAYYVGWSRCQGVPYNHAIGAAVSHDGGSTFSRLGDGPVISRTVKEPYIQNSPCTVLKIDGVFHLWYSSGVEWKLHDGKPESVYVLMHATSKDGIDWQRSGERIMPAVVDDECQTNPSVIKLGDRWHMWFCWRHGLDFRNSRRSYRMGYAWSDDLVTWHREDDASVLEPSASGWDSEMVCYPAVFTPGDGRTYMLYSGNGFGRDGFGIAELGDTPYGLRPPPPGGNAGGPAKPDPRRSLDEV